MTATIALSGHLGGLAISYQHDYYSCDIAFPSHIDLLTSQLIHQRAAVKFVILSYPIH